MTLFTAPAITTNRDWHRVKPMMIIACLTMVLESLSTVTLKESGVHVYVGKVNPTMHTKIDDGKQYYDLWFILEG